jgi:hypothetical protein
MLKELHDVATEALVAIARLVGDEQERDEATPEFDSDTRKKGKMEKTVPSTSAALTQDNVLVD